MRDLLYVDDLVELMLRAYKDIDRTAGQVFNVGGGPANTISVWTEFRDLLGPLISKLPSVNFDESRPGDQRIYLSDIRKAQTQLGWPPREDRRRLRAADQ